jgi:hypothetical protein
MVQATTQGKGIPGLMEHIYQRMDYYNKLPQLIVEAQNSGEAAQGDPELLFLAYVALVQGFVLFLLNDDEMKRKITPQILTSVLRNPGKSD